MSDSNQQLSIAVPGEWMLKKTLGPVLDELGTDLEKLYSTGKNKIIVAAYKKIKNKNDENKANLRVTRDVLWNGSFTDEEICAEYFGGVLAASRSTDGKNDVGVYYVDLIKSLSSMQLALHYLIYFSLNKILIADKKNADLNAGREEHLHNKKVFLSIVEATQITKNDDLGRDPHILNAKGLLSNFQTNVHKTENNEQVPFLKAGPTSLGIQLYAVAHNELNDWRHFSKTDFGSFDTFEHPKYFGSNIEQLIKSAEEINTKSKKSKSALK